MRFQSLGMGAQEPLARRLFHDRRGRRRRLVLLPARPQRGSVLRHQDHGGAGRMARRDHRGHAEAGHRAARAQAAGNAEARLPAQLHHAPASRRSSSICKAARRRSEVPDHLVSRPQEHRRYPPHACRPASSARASTTSSATRSASSTASRPTASPIASCATMSKTSARGCLQVPDVSKIEILGAQDERIFVEFSMQELASLGIDRSALIAALQAQNVVQPAGTIQTGNERLSLRVSGAFRVRAGHSQRQFRRRRTHAAPQRHRTGPARLCRSAAAAVPRQRPAGHRPCHRHARRRRHPGARQATSSARWPEITADLPIGIEPKLVADQAVTVESAIAEFMTSLWQAVAIILVVSFISLGVRPGLVIALSIPLTLAVVFSIMQLAEHRHAAHLARRADHRARAAGRRCHDDHRRHAHPAGRRRRQGRRPRPSRSAPMRSPCSPARW